MLRSYICKNVYSRLNIGKCVATLRDTFFGVFLSGTRFFCWGVIMVIDDLKLFIRRLMWFILLILGIITIVIWFFPEIIIGNDGNMDETIRDLIMQWPDLIMECFVIIDVLIFSVFISTLFLSCKVYDYNGNSIVVYAGWFHNYIKVNGKKFDEHNTFTSYTAILLPCVLDDGTDVKVTITRSNRISLKINNRLYTQRN